MNDRLVALTFTVVDPVDAGVVGTSALMTMIPFNATLVYVCVSPYEDDAGATIDIQDDGTDIVTAVDASDHDVPGEWISTHFGGTNAPVSIAAGSEIEIDVNNAAAENAFHVSMLLLAGEVYG